MSPCPDTEQLRTLEAGRLSDEQAVPLTRHIGQCKSCSQLLSEFREGDLDGRVIRAAIQGADLLAANGAGAADAASTDAVFQAGTVWDIPDYKRLRLCGEGAFGTVWAVQDRVGVLKALKTIDLARMRDAKIQCRESTALEAYCRHVQRHPNLIEISHVGIRGDLLYYTMELADDAISRKPIKGTIPDTYRPLTLQRIIDCGPIGVDTAMEVVLRLLRGLYRLHIVDLAHRDIKPANIIFVQYQPKIADVGMLTATGATPSQVGTPEYMPPDRRMDLTADTYAMGRVLFELIFGADGGDYPTPPDDDLPETDTWDMERVFDVLAKAASPNSADRYSRADLMYDDLEACRRIPYESLFSELDGATGPPARKRNPYKPFILATIHVLPWMLVLVLAIVLAWKLL